jgi:hypothetical protein
LSSIVVLDCGKPSVPAISVTVAARLFSRKYSRIAKARSADLTAAPDAGFDFADMPRTHQLIDRIMLVCGSEVYGREDDTVRVLEAVLFARVVEYLSGLDAC